MCQPDSCYEWYESRVTLSAKALERGETIDVNFL